MWRVWEGWPNLVQMPFFGTWAHKECTNSENPEKFACDFCQNAKMTVIFFLFKYSSLYILATELNCYFLKVFFKFFIIQYCTFKLDKYILYYKEKIMFYYLLKCCAVLPLVVRGNTHTSWVLPRSVRLF